MKPFDLEKALAGNPVITRDGRPVLEIVLLKSDVATPLIVVIQGTIKTSIYHIRLYSRNGMHSASHESSLDLFMAPTTKKYWAAISTHCPEGKLHLSYYAHDNEEQARAGYPNSKLISFDLEE